jgi:XRE family transcriptional regulator, regulator of sulfur utilization
MPPKKTSIYQALGEVIRSAREARGESRQDLAARAEFDPGDYGAIERGEYRLTYLGLKRIAQALELPADELIERAERAELHGGEL